MKPGLAVSVACGLVSSLLFLAVLGSPAFVILQYVAQLPLFMAGLGFGLTGLLIASGVAAAVTVPAGLNLALIFVAGYAVPVVLIVRFALLSRPAADGGVEWYPAGRLLALLAGYGALALVVVGLLAAGAEGGLHGQVIAALDELFAALGSEKLPDELQQQMQGFAYLLPAMFVVSAMLVTIVNGLFAQSILNGMGRNLRPGLSYIDLELPDWLALGLSAAVVVLWLGDPQGLGFIAAAVAIVLATPFFFQGLAVVHALARRSRSPGMVLVVFYVLLALLLWLALFVTVLGVVEQRARFRARLGST